jgi:hypothetical protein
VKNLETPNFSKFFFGGFEEFQRVASGKRRKISLVADKLPVNQDWRQPIRYSNFQKDFVAEIGDV